VFCSQFELLDLDLQGAALNICFVLGLGGFIDGFCPDTHIYIISLNYHLNNVKILFNKPTDYHGFVRGSMKPLN